MRVLTTALHVEQLRRCGLDTLIGEIPNPTNDCLFTNGGSPTVVKRKDKEAASLDALTTGVPAFPNAPPIANGLLLPLRSIFGLPEEEHLRQVRLRLDDERRGVAPEQYRTYKGTEGFRGGTGSTHGGGVNNNSFVVWGTAKRRQDRFVGADPAASPSALANSTRTHTLKLSFFDPPKTTRSASLLDAYIATGRVTTAAHNVLQHDTHKNVNVGTVSLLHSVAATTRDVAVFDAIAKELFTEISVDASGVGAGKGRTGEDGTPAKKARIVIRSPHEFMTRTRMREAIVSDLNAWRRDFEAAPPRYSTHTRRTACDICCLPDHTTSADCAVFQFHKQRRRARNRAGLQVGDHRSRSIRMEKQRRALASAEEAAVASLEDGSASSAAEALQIRLRNMIADASSAEAARPSSSSDTAAASPLDRAAALSEWTIVIDREDAGTPWGFFSTGMRLSRVKPVGGATEDKRVFAVTKGGRPSSLEALSAALATSAAATSDDAIVATASSHRSFSVYRIVEVNSVPVANAAAMIAAVQSNRKALDCESDPDTRLRLTVTEHRITLPFTAADAAKADADASSSAVVVRAGDGERRRVRFADDEEGRSATSGHDNRDGRSARDADDSAAEAAEDDVATDSLLPPSLKTRFGMAAGRARVVLTRRSTDVRWGLNAQGLRLIPFSRSDEPSSTSSTTYARAASSSGAIKDILLTDPSVASSSRVYPAPQPQTTADSKRSGSVKQVATAAATPYVTDVVFIIRGINDVRIDSADGLHAVMGRLGSRVLRLSMLVEQMKLPLIYVELDAGGANSGLPIGFSLFSKGRIASLSGDNTIFGRALLEQAPTWCNLRPDFGSKLKSIGRRAGEEDDDERERAERFLNHDLLYDRGGVAAAQWRAEEVNGVRDYELRSLKDVMADLKAGTGTVRIGLRMVVPVLEQGSK